VTRIKRSKRAIQAGGVWVNCFHAYQAHAPFGGYKKSEVGRENHKMMLSHTVRLRICLASYDKDKLGFLQKFSIETINQNREVSGCCLPLFL
jgi:hypothetical protein